MQLKKPFSIISLLSITIAGVYLFARFTQSPPAQNTDSLISFNEGYGASVNDTAGNLTAGTITNAAWRTSELCKTDKCLFFDGTGDYVSFADNSNLDMAAADNVTIEGWFRTPDITSGARSIVSKYETTGSDGGYRIYINSSGQIIFGIDDNNTSFPLYSVTSSAAYDDNLWHHFAAVKSGTASITLYMDGQSVGTTSITSTAADNNDSFYIGRFQSDTSQDFLGFIDEVKILRTARTADEIKADFAGGTPSRGTSASFGPNPSWISDGLIGYWKLDETSGNAADSSGNNLTLTNNGTTPFSNGKFGKSAGSFNGTSRYFSTASTISNVSAVSMWIYPASTTNNYFQLASGKYVTSSSGTLSAAGFVNPTFYVNGIQTTSISANTWQLLTITDTVSHSASALEIGRANGAYFANGGYIDEVRLYNRTLSPAEISKLYAWAPEPIAYFKLDENTNTTVYSSVSNSSGTLYGTNTRFVPGKFGSAVSFNGTNSLIEIGDDDSLDFDASDSLSVSAWVYITRLTSDAEIVSKKLGYADTQIGWTLYQFSTANGGNICAYISDATNQSEACSADLSTNNSLNRWEHWAFTFDRSTRYTTLYRNGLKVNYPPYDVIPATIGSIANSNCARIGSQAKGTPCNGATGGNPFSGYIDDVRIYNYVRSQSQIIEDMNASHPAPGSPIGSATAYWKFDTGHGTTAFDSSPNSLNLTLSSASWTNSGKYGKAFNGTGGAVRASIADNAALDFDTAESFSLSLWFKSDSATPPTSANQWVIHKRTSNAAGAIGYATYFNSSGQYCFGIDDDATSFPEDVTCTTANLFDQTWHHLLAVKTENSKLEIYLDGQPNGTPDTSISATGSLDNAGSLYLADQDTDDNATANAEELHGDLDEVKIYHSALNPQQALIEYNQGSMVNIGAFSTDASGNPSWSAANEYCPPGQGSACTSPVAELKFDENSGTSANDSSNNAVTGTLHSTASFNPGKFGSALYLDGNTAGNDSHVQLPDNVFNSLTQGTISLWYKSNLDNTASDFQNLLAGYETAGGTLWEFGYQISDNTLHFYSNTCGTTFDHSAPGPGNQAGWHHAVLTVDPSGYQIYVDGILSGSGSTNCFFDDLADTGTENYALGCYNFGAAPACNADELWRGFIDNFKIYDYARTPAQIAWEYNRGRPQGFWKFDENSGTTAYDSSENNYHSQTFTGNTTWTTGKFNAGLIFDGTDDLVRITEKSGIDFGSTTDNYSISAWFKTAANYTTNPGTIVAKNDGSGVYPFDLQVNTSEQPCVVMNDGTNRTLCGSQTVNDNNWHLITAVRDTSTDTIYLYIDGALANSQNDSTTASMNNNDDVSIGNSGSGTYTTNDFNGSIDSVRIFNYNLNPYQVKLLFNENSTARL